MEPFRKKIKQILTFQEVSAGGAFRENEAEDRRCAQKVKEVFKDQRKKGCPISGIIIDPIQAEGGDNDARNEFFLVRKNYFYFFCRWR